MHRPLLLASLLSVVACASNPPSLPQRMVVFFPEWSAQIDDGARQVIGIAAAELKAAPRQPATVIGYADPSGTPQANQDVSELRAQNVYDGLVANGIDPSRIQRVSRGAVDFVQTSQESRRVEIVLGR